MTPDSLIGAVVGDCLIERLLGQGGMGAVFQGMHTTLRVPVAVKFLVPAGDGTTVDRVSAQRFMREAQVMAQLRHPNIVRVLNVQAVGDTCFMVMELLAGATLGDHIERRGQLPVDEVRSVGRQVAEALAHAHAHGVVHRDIKPDNIMITPEGSAVVMDFGIASAVSARGERLTRQGYIVGTPHYFAPEQARSSDDVDARADLYALGVVLYEALAGALPFAGNDPLAQLMARLSEEPIPLVSRRRDAPPELVALIAKMMAREVSDRVQSADEVALALVLPSASATVVPPAPMAVTQDAPSTARASELTAMATTAGLPLSTPQGAHMLELRLADIRAFLRLAESESLHGAALLLVHHLGEVDVLAFIGGRSVASLRVVRGTPVRASLGEVLERAMRRGEGAVVARRIDPEVVATLRTWTEGPRALGPLPADILDPMRLFARIRRTRTSGVLAVHDGGQTTLARLDDGAVRGVCAAPLHRPEIATDTEGGIGVWLEGRSTDAVVTLNLAGDLGDAIVASASDETLRGALAAAGLAASSLAASAAREFGLGSAQVFSKSMRSATAPMRDVVPLAAITSDAPFDAAKVWEALSAGARTGREMAVRLAVEAVLTGALNAARELIPEKKLARASQSALAASLEQRSALDALGLTDAVRRLLA